MTDNEWKLTTRVADLEMLLVGRQQVIGRLEMELAAANVQIHQYRMAALQELTDQAQALDMGYGKPAPDAAAVDQLRRMGINYMTKAGRDELEDWITANGAAKP